MIELLKAGSVRACSGERGAEATAADAYSGLSVCHYTGDAAEHVTRSRERLAASLSLPTWALVIPRQTHGERVAVIDAAPIDPASLEGVDAMVTTATDVALCINTADCVPVTLADAEAGVIAAAHCGWRGTVNALLANTIAAMRRLGADPCRIVAAMGPSICARCFEVGEEVAERFRSEFPDAADVVIEGGVKPHVDLGAAIEARLLSLGVKKENVARPSACTACDSLRFFSARRLGVASGRMPTWIVRRRGGAVGEGRRR